MGFNSTIKHEFDNTSNKISKKRVIVHSREMYEICYLYEIA